MNPLVRQLVQYINIPSISGEEGAFLQVLEKDFQERGYIISRQPVQPGRWNLLALPKAPPKLLFSTHVDVVPPHITARIEGGRVYGRGACDTKGGLVAMMAAADRLDPKRDWIGFLLVVGEEVDHCGAEAARDLAFTPQVIVLCEPTEGKVVSGQKGILKLGLSSEGVAAHSAFPGLGVDALAPLLESLEALRAAEYHSDTVLGPTTLNIGLLNAGVAANVTPPTAAAELVYRVTGDLDELREKVESLCHHDVELKVLSQNPPVRLHTARGFEKVPIAFNTDAFYLERLAPVVLMGPGDIRTAHSDDEHLLIDDLMSGVEEYIRLVDNLMGTGEYPVPPDSGDSGPTEEPVDDETDKELDINVDVDLAEFDEDLEDTAPHDAIRNADRDSDGHDAVDPGASEVDSADSLSDISIDVQVEVDDTDSE